VRASFSRDASYLLGPPRSPRPVVAGNYGACGEPVAATVSRGDRGGPSRYDARLAVQREKRYCWRIHRIDHNGRISAGPRPWSRVAYSPTGGAIRISAGLPEFANSIKNWRASWVDRSTALHSYASSAVIYGSHAASLIPTMRTASSASSVICQRLLPGVRWSRSWSMPTVIDFTCLSPQFRLSSNHHWFRWRSNIWRILPPLLHPGSTPTSGSSGLDRRSRTSAARLANSPCPCSLVSAASGGYVKRSSGFWGRMPPPLAPEAGG